VTTPTPTHKAAAYLRVSGQRQAGDDHYSLPVQLARFETACRQHRWLDVGHFEDQMSGKIDKRPAYQRMLVAIRHGDINVVVVQFLDRFGRNPKEILRRYWELEELNVTVHVTDEDIREELMLMVRAFVAGKESEKTSARVGPAMHAALDRGRWVGRPPFGLDLDTDPRSATRGKLTPNAFAPVIVRIFDLYASGSGGHAGIAGRLNREGVPSPRGGVWWSGQIAEILRTEAYAGRPMWKGYPLAGGCPPIIDRDLWDRAQAAWRRRAWTASPHDPMSALVLAGLVVCGRCGRPLHCWSPSTSRRTGLPAYYYRCAGYSGSRTCDLPAIRAEKVETFVVAMVRSWQLPGDAHPTTADAPVRDDRERLATERRRLEGQLARFRDRRSRLLDDRMDRVIDQETFAAKDAEYLADAALIERELRSLVPAAPAVDPAEIALLLRDFGALWDNAPVPGRRALLGQLIDRVRVQWRDTFEIVPRGGLEGVTGVVGSGKIT
jgi:DNA invertase Pin-like site-specific DNA recombinase